MVKANLKRQDWYYYITNSTSVSTEFIVVHKRWWHMHHDVQLSKTRSSLSMPKSLICGNNGVYFYNKPVDKCVKFLSRLGFVEMPEYYTGMHAKYTRIGGRDVMVCFTPDTVDIYKISSKAIKTGNKYDNIDDFKKAMVKYANAHGCVVDDFRIVDCGIIRCYVSMMSKLTYANLPCEAI